MISVLRLATFVTVQDLGRTGHRAAAVPPGGALDRLALEAANLLVGNPPDAAGLEWAAGPGELRFERAATVALAGALVEARVEGRPVPPAHPVTLPAGSVLEIRGFERGAWLYIAVAGGIAVPPVLGSRATYEPGRFGGLEGRPLRAGDVLPVGAADPRGSVRSSAGGPPHSLPAPALIDPQLFLGPPGEPIALLPGPDRSLLPDSEWRRLVEGDVRVSHAVSRMGYRLEGVRLAVPEERAPPSAPAAPGVVQVPPGGAPIVLLADGPTVGGYPRVGVIATAHLGRLVQRRPGEPVRFREIGIAEARSALRDRRALLDRLAG